MKRDFRSHAFFLYHTNSNHCAVTSDLSTAFESLFSRVAFGVSNSGGMLDALVAIAVPATQSAGFYKTSPDEQIAPTPVCSN